MMFEFYVWCPAADFREHMKRYPVTAILLAMDLRHDRGERRCVRLGLVPVLYDLTDEGLAHRSTLPRRPSDCKPLWVPRDGTEFAKFYTQVALCV